MINAQMRFYDYYTIGGKDAYGQAQLSEDIQGSVKMAINISSQTIQDNINYQDCNYVGLTMAELDDSYVIKYGNEKLKVQYVNPRGRYNLVYLTRI